METKENVNKMIQTFFNTAKAVLRGMLIAIQAYLKKQYSLKQLTHTQWNQKKKSKKSQRPWKKKIIKIRVETNKKDTKKSKV